MPTTPIMLRLKAVARVEPGALIRVLQPFQDRDIVPHKVTAQRLLLRCENREVMHVEIELAADITMDVLRIIAARITQLPITLSTVFGHDPSRRPDND